MREANRLPQPSIVDIDPEDPLQQLDDAGQFSIVPLAVEVQSETEAEADVDFAALEVAAAEVEGDENAEDGFFVVEAEAEPKDTGDLYGVRTPKATDRRIEQTSDNEEYLESDEGETWLETLSKAASEGGTVPDEDVRPVDDSDPDFRTHSATDHRDRPVADKGSGGLGGL